MIETPKTKIQTSIKSQKLISTMEATIHDEINSRRRARGPGLQDVVGRVPSRGGTFVTLNRYGYQPDLVGNLSTRLGRAPCRDEEMRSEKLDVVLPPGW